MRLYVRQNVLDAALERIEFIFDRFETIVISVSGGKDSTLMEDLVERVARARNRQVHAFFIDQEAEYASTIEIIRHIMTKDYIVPHWFQVPIHMTNATSYDEDFLYAWGPGEAWMRPKDPLAIHALDEEYPQRFYPFIDWFESRWEPGSCFLVALRAEESLNRYRAVIKNPGYEDVMWSTRGKGNIVKFYPIYDWSFDDIFYHFYHHGVKYNRIYDFLHAKDDAEHITKFRVSNLIHEKAYKSLSTLQEFEHDTYEALIRRLRGTRTAARYADEATIYSNLILPDRFDTWLDYRDYLLATIPGERLDIFRARFARQEQTEYIYKQQVRQLLINDWENNVPVHNRPADQVEDWRQKWLEIL